VEEADESEYWLKTINEANLSNAKEELKRHTKESNKITKIMTKAKNSSYGNSK